MPRVEDRLIAMNNRAEQLFKEGKSGAAQDMLDLVNTRTFLEIMLVLKRLEQSLKALSADKGKVP
jgi:hypothetical protein